MIDSAYFWWNVFFLAIGTLAIRFSIVAISSHITISDRHRELFTYIPAAIIPALIVPMCYFHKGQVAWLAGKERLFVLGMSTVVCYFSRNMIVTVCFGLITLYLITQL